MKQLLLLMAALLAVSTASSGQRKVEDRSAKKRPAWVGAVMPDHIVASSAAPTLEEAKRKCMDIVKVEMLASVAQNVEYSTETLLRQLTHNDEVSSDMEFSQHGRTSVARLPYLVGVSESKAVDAYWELTSDRDAGTKEYTYSLLYPFGVSDRYRLSQEFERQEENVTRLVERYRNALPGIAHTDSIASGIAGLKLAEDYYFDELRRSDVRSIIERYHTLLSQLSVVSERVGRGQYVCHIVHDGSIIRSSTLPRCKSESATRISAASDGDGGFIITFSDEDCIPDDDNRISLVFPLYGRNLKHTIHF